MAVAHAGSSAIAASTGADITVTLPGHAANDLFLVHATARSNAVTCLTPAGWTRVAGPTDSGTTWRAYWFWLRAASAAETNPLLDWSAVTGNKYAQAWILTGAITSGDPFAAFAATAGTADPGIATGVTTTAASQFVGASIADADNLATGVTVTATDPAAWTQRTAGTTAIGLDAGFFHADATRATAGATGNVSVDFNGVPLAWSTLVVAIIEAPPAVRPRFRRPALQAVTRASIY